MFDTPLILLLFLAGISALWSEVPTLTLRREFAVLGTTLFGVYFGNRYTHAQQLKLLAWALGFAVIVSFVYVIAYPGYGVMMGSADLVGSWRGGFAHKNSLGRAMVLSCIVFFFLARSRRTYLYWAGAVVSVALVILSRSMTALLILVFLLFVSPLWKLTQKPLSTLLPYAAVATAVILASYAWITENIEVVLAALGKDPTLTGRTVLWTLAIEHVAEHPLFGWGYNAFWSGSGGSAVRWSAGWLVPHAHNGYLDLCLDLGIVGLCLFLLSFGLRLRRAMKEARHTNITTRLFPLVVLSFIFLYNFTESSILTRNSVFWIVYVAVSCGNFRGLGLTTCSAAGLPLRKGV
ncbi:MAG: O-antigen ligase family protein [Terriglobales bacterium]